MQSSGPNLGGEIYVDAFHIHIYTLFFLHEYTPHQQPQTQHLTTTLVSCVIVVNCQQWKHFL